MHVLITGTRGVPARHGGFETFAHDLSLFLISRGHKVTVYCQSESGNTVREDVWNGVHRVFIPAPNNAYGTVVFDWAVTRHSSNEKGIVLTLGYNTGIFNLLYRLRQIPSVMNMDGIEWKRDKWSFPQRMWLWFNEWAGGRAANHLIADHPGIAKHLARHTSRRKITVIPYGADAVLSAPLEHLERFGLATKQYDILIARPEPENSILEIVRAYSQLSRPFPLVVLGNYSPDENDYQREVLSAAGPSVRFLGAIYEREVVRSLRFHARAYLHGHRVGGTNPSLVESLAAGNAVVAHENQFTRWVAGTRARYFSNSDELRDILNSFAKNPDQLHEMEQASRLRHSEKFTQEDVLSAYEALLMAVLNDRVIAFGGECLAIE